MVFIDDSTTQEFTDSDLLYYSRAMTKALMYLNTLLSIYKNNPDVDPSVMCMLDNRLKSRRSINEKIAKKKELRGEKFLFRVDLMDIAGLRVIFSDVRDYLDYGGDVKKLDSEIKKMTPEEFIKKFTESSFKSINCDLRNLYGFVGLMINSASNYSEILSVDIIKDYVEFQKESGYQSIHVIINVLVERVDEKGNFLLDENGDVEMIQLPVEVQLRNFCQHLFDQFEHKNGYKGDTAPGEDYCCAFNIAKKSLMEWYHTYLKTKTTGDKFKF